ncbi:MAG: hypothetical protein HY737_07045 [Candidatus Omnitrophica bacterium]|nr:hypothetical protein [Candidatus Omnitrophota bacterium]
MVNGQVHDPQVFITVLREYHEAPSNARGALANTVADAIITKRVDLAQVRQHLIHDGAHELLETLDRLIDLIEPYIEEGGVEE